MSKRRAVKPPPEDDGESSDAPLVEPSRKRKKIDPTEICVAIYEVVRNHKRDDGTLLCDAFIRMPKKRQDPAYYEKVANPIDMQRIQQRIRTDEYEDVEDMTADVSLLVKNAKLFYKKSSQEYKDAAELWELYKQTKAKLTESDDRSSVESEKKGKIILKVGKLARKAAAAAEARRMEPDIDETSESSCNFDDENGAQIEELFACTMQATDSDSRSINQAFMLLPSRKRYPEYYEVIEHPIDLKQIAKKIQAGKYNTIADVERDLLLVMKNACSFNETGSQIYKDAKVLKKLIISKKNEIVQGKHKVRRKRSRNQTQSLSAITAAIKDEEDFSDPEEEAVGNEDDPDNPRWQLYNVVKNLSNASGYQLSEPFWKLPSKKVYSDYYKEIKNPVALFQIKNKLVKGSYGTVSEVAGDLNVMFENAKKYNRPDSRLYKDAVKLQRVMQTKVRELLDFDHDSDSGSDSDNSPILKRDTPPVKKAKGRKSGFIKGKYKDNLPLRKRLLSICKTLIEYAYDDGRQPILMFMEKPSKKLYPEYYKVITEPVDLLEIQANIKAEKYTSEDTFIADLKLMFANCRKFNEENSVISKDANSLEKILNEKLKELGPLETPKKQVVHKVYKPRRKTLPVDSKLKFLFDTVRDFKDVKGQKLSEVFAKLPSRTDYRDYYEIIKKPIDMEKIANKMKQAQYDSLEELVADLILMLDNACKFNEPDSHIYKAALQLQRLVLQTKRQILEDGSRVPDVQGAVQELLTALFSSVYNHQDEEGRCFSDSLQELPEHDEIEGKKVRGLSLDIVKRRLDRGLYKRLDRFQEDVFACLDRARKLSRTDSQVFEDSIELQAFFVRQRDDFCRNGDLLSTPALNYNLLHLSAAVELQKQQKLLKESPAEEEAEVKPPQEEQEANPVATTGAMVHEGSQEKYHVGDFVYVTPRERNAEPAIIHILRGWTNTDNIQMLYGDCFFRPDETYHVQTRRFLEKEVFKSDQNLAVPLSEVMGRCCVMSVKEYFTMKPEGYKDADVYVCESRYSSRSRSFKKIKMWPFSSDRLTLTPREEPIEPKRIMSVFRDRLEKHITEIAELEEHEKLDAKEYANIELMNMPASPEITAYYQQLSIPVGVIKTGDFVYVETETGKLIAQIDSMWSNKEGEYFLKGPWFLRPQEIAFMPGRMFYRQEVFQGCLEDTLSVRAVVGRCCVMELNDYISCRPTEINEKDAFICQSTYNAYIRQLTKLPTGLKRYTHSDNVCQDEVYNFRRTISPVKVVSEALMSPQPLEVKTPPRMPETTSDLSLLTGKAEQDMLSMMEDSLDGGPSSVGSSEIAVASPVPILPLSKAQKEQLLQKSKTRDKDGKGKVITGYILYSGEIRKNITVTHPEATFGEISRMVGNEWRQLSTDVKQTWEEKAAKITEELKEAKLLEESTPQPNPPGLPPNWVFECLWDNCDYQFEDLSDCFDHVMPDSSGHVAMYFSAIPPKGTEIEYQCQWKNCNRVKKNAQPFPSITRIIKHVKEVHLLKANGRTITPHERTKNYIPSRRPRPQANLIAGLQMPGGQQYISGVNGLQILSLDSPNQTLGGTTPQMNQRPAEPLFVTVPPRTQRLLHSDAYIKYIEGLSADNKYISNWDRMLRVTQENSPVVEESRLPGHWLANGPGNYGSVTNALWALRDFMMRDALNISKVI